MALPGSDPINLLAVSIKLLLAVSAFPIVSAGFPQAFITLSMRSNLAFLHGQILLAPVLQIVEVMHFCVHLAVVVEPFLGIMKFVKQGADVAVEYAVPTPPRTQACE